MSIISRLSSSLLVQSSKTEPPKTQQLYVFVKANVRSLSPRVFLPYPFTPCTQTLIGNLLLFQLKQREKPYATEWTDVALLISRSVMGEFGLTTSRSLRRHLRKEKRQKRNGFCKITSSFLVRGGKEYIKKGSWGANFPYWKYLALAVSLGRVVLFSALTETEN